MQSSPCHAQLGCSLTPVTARSCAAAHAIHRRRRAHRRWLCCSSCARAAPCSGAARRRAAATACALTLLLVPVLCAAAQPLAPVMCAAAGARARAARGRATACSGAARRRLGKERGGRKEKERRSWDARRRLGERERREDGEGEARPPLLAPGPRSCRRGGRGREGRRAHRHCCRASPRRPGPSSTPRVRSHRSPTGEPPLGYTLTVDGGGHCRCTTTAPGGDRGSKPRTAQLGRTNAPAPGWLTFSKAVFLGRRGVFGKKTSLTSFIVDCYATSANGGLHLS
jgi:hypothetical protein